MPRFISFDGIAAADSLATAQKAIGDGALHSMGTYDGSSRGIVSSGGHNWIRVAALNAADSWFKIACEHSTLVAAGVLTNQPTQNQVSAIARIESATSQNLVAIVSRSSTTICDVTARNGVSVGTIDLPRGSDVYIELCAKISQSSDGWIGILLKAETAAEMNSPAIMQISSALMISPGS